MSRVLPLFLLVACAAASAQETPPRYDPGPYNPVFDSPIRDAHVVTVSQERSGFVFEVEGQPYDLAAALNPGGTLVVAATDGLRVLVVAEDTGYYDSEYNNTEPLIIGPTAVWIDGRQRDEVGVLRVRPRMRRGEAAMVDVSILVCAAETQDQCASWTAARPRTRPDGPGGLDAGLFLRIVGPPIVYAPAPPDPPATPVRD